MMIFDLTTKTGFLSETISCDKPDFSWRIRLLPVDLSVQETRFLWVLSVRLFIYQAGETWFLKSPKNPVFPSLSMMIFDLKSKTGFLSEMRSHDKSGFSAEMRG
jgi:hypothetical protein